MALIVRAQRRGPVVIRGEVHTAQQEAAALLAAASGEAELIRAQSAARTAGELIALAAARARALASVEREAQHAILLVATKLLEGALEAEPERIASLIDPLLARVRRAESVSLRLHPEDARALEPRLDELGARAELEGTLVLVADPSLARGGCVVESDLGELDARLETRVTLLARALGWEYP